MYISLTLLTFNIAIFEVRFRYYRWRRQFWRLVSWLARWLYRNRPTAPLHIWCPANFLLHLETSWWWNKVAVSVQTLMCLWQLWQHREDVGFTAVLLSCFWTLWCTRFTQIIWPYVIQTVIFRMRFKTTQILFSHCV